MTITERGSMRSKTHSHFHNSPSQKGNFVTCLEGTLSRRLLVTVRHGKLPTIVECEGGPKIAAHKIKYVVNPKSSHRRVGSRSRRWLCLGTPVCLLKDIIETFTSCLLPPPCLLARKLLLTVPLLLRHALVRVSRPVAKMQQYPQSLHLKPKPSAPLALKTRTTRTTPHPRRNPPAKKRKRQKRMTMTKLSRRMMSPRRSLRCVPLNTVDCLRRSRSFQVLKRGAAPVDPQSGRVGTYILAVYTFMRIILTSTRFTPSIRK